MAKRKTRRRRTPQRRVRAVAVVDTNVLLDIHSCHDLVEKVEERYAILGGSPIDDRDVTYRIARAREGILFAMYLKRLGASTRGLHSELVAKMLENAPPRDGGECFKSDFVTNFIHFVLPLVLKGWTHEVPWRPDGKEGKAADIALVVLAKKKRLPLVTNEGYTKDGIEVRGLRKRALDAGVEVFTPAEFYKGKIDEAAEQELFLRLFERRAPTYIRERGINDLIGEVIAQLHGYFRLVLRGEVAGREVPAKVSVLR